MEDAADDLLGLKVIDKGKRDATRMREHRPDVIDPDGSDHVMAGAAQTHAFFTTGIPGRRRARARLLLCWGILE
jgi:hypothetical protein